MDGWMHELLGEGLNDMDGRNGQMSGEQEGGGIGERRWIGGCVNGWKDGCERQGSGQNIADRGVGGRIYVARWIAYNG